MTELELPETRTARTIGATPESDIVIVGAGLAGLFTALKLAPHPVTIISAAPLGNGASSAWAQGGIAAAMGKGDSPEKHTADTLVAGAGIVDEAIALLTAREANDRVHDLLDFGVPFDTTLEGTLKLSREAAHSERRIVRVKGDGAGKAIMAALIAAVRKAPSIRVIEGMEAKALGASGKAVEEVLLWPTGRHGHGQETRLKARAVILATGGVGQIYEVTTNPGPSKGEGFAMAYNIGAVAADAEFMQFHPTAINAGLDPAPLATEALRGEGATLINGRGDRFMLSVHDDAELAPRDIVARAVHREVTSGKGAFLDCTTAVGTRFAENFPTVYAKCTSAGIDPATQPIPIAPAAHYHMGGILTDARGRTSIDNLWACGEVASTGLHGANRLASNSLLEAIVFANRIAEDIDGLMPTPHATAERNTPVQVTATQTAMDDASQQILNKVRSVMANQVGVVRNGEGLESAISQLRALSAGPSVNHTVRNMLTTALTITRCALAREESRGGHFRSDFPTPVPSLATRFFASINDEPATRVAAPEDAGWQPRIIENVARRTSANG